MVPRNGLCVGLDLDVEKLPAPYKKQVVDLQRFGCDVVDATKDVASCYKFNLAFYEQYGRAGIDALYAIRERIGDAYVIADAKRGDIGNTSAAYAKAVFEDLQADAITVSPYMGRDSVGPFLDVQGKMVYVLALTSNPGSYDFQRRLVGETPLYELVMNTILSWPRAGDLGFVVGATNAYELAMLRTKYSDAPLLIPGIGAQGGDAEQTVAANAKGPAVFNVSRGLLYADATDSCIETIARLAREYNVAMMQ
ncbi:MAG: orotidine-5'-phosphate decarboxylase [Ignavibacteria bacterium]|nr:orotidine-5'-phosphate decarboxylase [Ignavibacteria bacterium]